MSKICKEQAEQEFVRFADAWELDTNVDAMNAEDRESFNTQKGRIVAQIERGRAVVSDNGDVLIFTARKASGDGDVELNFRIPNGSAFMRMDSHKERQNMARFFEVVAAMTGQPAKLFSALDGRDVKFCMGVAALFLG